MEYLPSLILAMVVCLAFPVSAQDKELTEEQLASIQLPMDPEDPVFEFDSFGGMRMAVPDDFEATPALRIYGDGKVVAGTSSPEIKSCTLMISEDQLNQFLHFVANQQRFYEISTKDLNEQMADSGQKLLIADAPNSRFSINLQRGTNSVQVYALNFVIKTFEEIEEFQRLYEIQKKSRKLIALCHLGNEQEREALLGEINKQVKGSNEELPSFSADDVRFATRFSDGRFRASFRKSVDATDDRPSGFVSAQVERQTADGPNKITVSVRGFGQ